MNAPQIIFVILAVIELLITAAKQGQPKGEYSIGEKIIDVGIMSGLLYWGGFFS